MGAAKKVALGEPAGGVPGKRGLGHGREEGFKKEAGPCGVLASVCLGNSGRGQDEGRRTGLGRLVTWAGLSQGRSLLGRRSPVTI